MRVWFNHWFSTAYHFIDMIKEQGHYVISTNRKNICVYQLNSDEFYVEPDISKIEYLNWCLEFCKKHEIDIFFPRHEMRVITENKNEFEKIGVKVICENNLDYYNILSSKKKTMDFFKANEICNVPDMLIVQNVEEFKEAYSQLKEKYKKICVKYDFDEGGTSFKLIEETKVPSINELTQSHITRINYDYLVDCLATEEKFRKLVVMPFLDGTEISIDCIGLQDKLLAIPRYKISSRFTKFEMNENIIDIANKFYSVMPLWAPFNIQLRYHEDTLYILEVNTRMAGGSWKAKFMGCDFPNLAINKSIDSLYVLPTPNKTEMLIGNLETGLIC